MYVYMIHITYPLLVSGKSSHAVSFLTLSVLFSSLHPSPNNQKKYVVNNNNNIFH